MSKHLLATHADYLKALEAEALKGPYKPRAAIVPTLHLNVATLDDIRSMALSEWSKHLDGDLARAYVQATLTYLYSQGLLK